MDKQSKPVDIAEAKPLLTTKGIYKHTYRLYILDMTIKTWNYLSAISHEIHYLPHTTSLFLSFIFSFHQLYWINRDNSNAPKTELKIKLKI